MKMKKEIFFVGLLLTSQWIINFRRVRKIAKRDC